MQLKNVTLELSGKPFKDESEEREMRRSQKYERQSLLCRVMK